MPNTENSNSKKSSGGFVGFIIILVVAFFILIGSCSNNKVDSSFLNKDPRQWTQDEKRQYNNWQQWEYEQSLKKR